MMTMVLETVPRNAAYFSKASFSLSISLSSIFIFKTVYNT